MARESQKLKIDQVLSPSTSLATAARTANIDCQGVDYATIICNFPSETNTSAVGPTVKIYESDATVVTSGTTIATAQMDLVAAQCYHFKVKPRYRYLGVQVVPGTHTTNDTTIIGCVAALELEKAPATTTEMVVDTSDQVVVVS